jgi:large subunit ribosomal protein L23
MRQVDLMELLEAPIVSEKSTLSAENHGRIVFRVKKGATKDQIKRAVELMFKVEVDSVHVLNVKGKVKRFGRFTGLRSDWKKAYVKLRPGFDIDFSVT